VSNCTHGHVNSKNVSPIYREELGLDLWISGLIGRLFDEAEVRPRPPPMTPAAAIALVIAATVSCHTDVDYHTEL
jgi:hypothetical protein